MKLLIVDDEPIIRRGIKSLVDFEQLKITEVFEASNGEMALKLFKEHLPDLVLADINMPKMNGLEFTEKAKAIKSDTKIALITGYDYFDYAHKAIKLGVDDYILKPVSKSDIEQLLAKLTQAIRASVKEGKTKEIIEQMQSDDLGPSDSNYKKELEILLDQHLNDAALSLTFLAEEMGLSLGYLSSLFKQLFQVSFKEYVLKARLDKARIMLLSSDLKNYEISEAIGFNDPNYFSLVFKKRYGMSPNQYRRKAGDKE